MQPIAMSPTKLEVIILRTDLISKFDFSRPTAFFTKRIKHIDGTVLFEPILSINECPNWAVIYPKYNMCLNQLKELGLLVEEETRPRNDLSAEATFRAMTAADFYDTRCKVIGTNEDKGWVVRINNSEQDAPVYQLSDDEYFINTIPDEYSPTLEELRAGSIVNAIPPGEYIIFSPSLTFEDEPWFSFKTNVALNIRLPLYSSTDDDVAWMAGLFLSPN